MTYETKRIPCQTAGKAGRGGFGNHRFTRQLMCDVAMIALNDAFGFGPERLKRFADKLVEVFAVYAERWNADDKDTEYTRAKLDGKLKQICGPYFVPWEERYGQ